MANEEAFSGDVGVLRQWAEDVWIADGRTTPFYSVPYPTRMTIVRLGEGSLAIISPIRLADSDVNAIDALGPVRALIAPNKLHHLFLGEWKERYQDAKLYAAPGLAKRRKDLRFDAELGDRPDPEWAGDLDQTILAGSLFMEEVIFFHRRSRTLIVTDCIQRFRPEWLNPFHRLLMRLDGMLGPKGGMPREWRASFINRKRARAAVERMIEWMPETIIIAHGDPVTEDAMGYLRHSFRWLFKK